MRFTAEYNAELGAIIARADLSPPTEQDILTQRLAEEMAHYHADRLESALIGSFDPGNSRGTVPVILQEESVLTLDAVRRAFERFNGAVAETRANIETAFHTFRPYPFPVIHPRIAKVMLRIARGRPLRFRAYLKPRRKWTRRK